MSRVKSGSHYTIYGFMRDDLGLIGDKLVVFAVVHEFTLWQGAFINNFELIADWLECGEDHVVDVLKELCEDGLVSLNCIGDKFVFMAKVTKNDY